MKSNKRIGHGSGKSKAIRDNNDDEETNNKYSCSYKGTIKRNHFST